MLRARESADSGMIVLRIDCKVFSVGGAGEVGPFQGATLIPDLVVFIT